MKKTAILFLSLASAVAVNAQGLPQIDPVLEPQDAPAKRAYHKATPESGAANVIWSEDFANGIPTGWSQTGTPATAVWEYRGPNTTPDNTSGGRGQYSGINNTPPTNDPIFSSSTSNGFMIFDSDYLDNGNTTTFGSGSAPAPHVGRLTTDMIDLSMYPQVELKFETYARRFYSNWFVAFSTDGGATFGDTIEFFDPSVVAVNAATANGETALANISSAVGGQDSVVMQFIFDGTDGNANGNGYYFWMIDDIEIRTPPANQMLFTTWNGAPAQDMIYNGSGAYPKYGIMNIDQIVPVEFDANFYNYGTQTQTNATLEVEVWDNTSGTPSLVTTVSAPGCPTLASGDTCDYNDLTTVQWTPPAQEASYLLVYKAISDSISSSSAAVTTDTFALYVNEQLYSTDRNQVDNYVGTNSANPEIIAMGVMYDLVNEYSANPGTGLVYIDGVNIELSALTDSTADIEIAFFDTTGFEFGTGFPSTATAAFRKSFTLNGSLIGGNAFFDLSSNGNPLALPAQPYLMIVNFFPNATDGVIRIANDASFDQPGIATVMQLADGNWYGGFTSQAHEGTFIRLQTSVGVGVEEQDLINFSVYPNPTAGETNIMFSEGGAYTIDVMDMVGNRVLSMDETVNTNETIEMDLSDLPTGVYLVNVKGENSDKTIKLTVK